MAERERRRRFIDPDEAPGCCGKARKAHANRGLPHDYPVPFRLQTVDCQLLGTGASFRGLFGPFHARASKFMKLAFSVLAVALLLVAARAADPLPDGQLLTLRMGPSPGERFRQVVFSCWLPDTPGPLRAVIIHQHGCTSATPEKQPPVTLDAHWRALARLHGCALLSPMYQVDGQCDEWNDPDSGSERALFAAFAEFASQSGHPELRDAPWLLWGHSGGSSWSAQMIVRHPRRILAASFRGGCHKQFGVPEFRARFAEVARELPLLFVWGKRESVPASSHFVSWVPMNTMFGELRAQGGKVGRLIDPQSEHGCDNSRLVIIPFFDAVLRERAAPGVLVDCASLEAREMTAANRTNPALAWLPTEALSRVWREFSQQGTLTPIKPRLASPQLAATREANGQVRLTWRVEPALDGGVRALRLQRDGAPWKEFGPGAGRLLATSGDGPPVGLRESGFVDDSRASHSYVLSFVDVAGNESPPSETVRLPLASL